jgi:DNA-directed RNA polymerase specialized sigma24 family protein
MKQIEHALAAIRARPNDELAWKAAYFELRPPVLGYLYMLGFREAADREDLASEVFFRFLAYSPWSRDWTTLPDAPVITAYLRTTAQRVAYDAMRSRSRARATAEMVSTAEPERVWIESAGESLTASEREFLAAYVDCGYSLAALAAERAASYSATATQLHRIRRKIRRSVRRP